MLRRPGRRVATWFRWRFVRRPWPGVRRQPVPAAASRCRGSSPEHRTWRRTRVYRPLCRLDPCRGTAECRSAPDASSIGASVVRSMAASVGRAVAPRSGIADATAKFQYQPRQLGDARRISAREIGNPIDLIHGKGLGRLTRAKLAANKAIDLITAKLVKVEANRSSLFKNARPQFFETSAKPCPAEEHAVRAVTAGCQIAAEF